MSDDNEKNEPYKKKRKRTIIPPEQVDKLESLFMEEPWPNRARKEILADQLGQSEHFVSVWFQNRRARFKKEELAKQQMFKKSHDLQIPREIASASSSDFKKSDACENMAVNIDAESRLNKYTSNENSKNNLPATEIKKVMKILVKPRVSCEERKYPNCTSAMRLMSSDNKDFVNAKPGTAFKHIFNVIPKEIPMKMLSSHSLGNEEESEKNQEIERRAQHKNTNEYNKENQMSFFKAIINMICVAEGGIMDKQDPDYNTAVNDALYGILVNGKSRLVYNKDTGLNFVPIQN